ncbi:hypothetical protein ACWEKM_37170 [Streptomyces sp. NPDC004752]
MTPRPTSRPTTRAADCAFADGAFAPEATRAALGGLAAPGLLYALYAGENPTADCAPARPAAPPSHSLTSCARSSRAPVTIPGRTTRNGFVRRVAALLGASPTAPRPGPP